MGEKGKKGHSVTFPRNRRLYADWLLPGTPVADWLADAYKPATCLLARATLPYLWRPQNNSNGDGEMRV